jgi:hypothetical protein
MYPTRKNNRIRFFRFALLSVVLLTGPGYCKAQDDLMKLLESETTENEKVIATFKGSKIINVETNETVRKKNLDFRISHLFGNIGSESGGSIHNLYGLDQSVDIRLGLHYGITDKLTVGVSRVKRNENLEGQIKYRLIEQTSNGKIPVSVTAFSNLTYTIATSEILVKDAYRLTYLTQLILARKFSPGFSFVLIPAFLHRNLVEDDDQNNTFSLSGGFRLRFTPSSSLIADYAYTFGRENVKEDYYDVFGLGLEIETGGHVFTIMLTNASGLLENEYLVNTQDNWADGGMKISFIISRMFSFTKSNK